MATSIIKQPMPWVDEPAIVPVREELVKAAVLQETHASAPGNTRVFSVEIQRNLTSSKSTSETSGDQSDGITSKIKDYPFKVVTHFTSTRTATDEESGERECHYASTAEEALQIYEDLYQQHASSSGSDGTSMQPVSSVSDSRWIGSEALRKTLLYRETYSSTEKLSPEVATLVDNVWKEAMGKLKEYLDVPVASILPGQVAKAEAVLYQLWNILHDRKSKRQVEDDDEYDDYDEERLDPELEILENEFYDLIPHKEYMRSHLKIWSRVATKLDLCQMIRDAVYISEETGWQKRPTPEAKYRALRCYIQHLPQDHPEHEKIKSLVLSTLPGEMKLNTLRIFAVSRPPEEEGYLHDIGNDTLLFHATKPNNVLGILSRGLLMPKVVVEMFNGQRRDEGLLGPGLYFGDRTSTCIQYTKNGYFSKTRMMLVLKVALGAVRDFYQFDTKLQLAPEGFQSTHGVRAAEGKPSEFTEDEYVVYSTKQQCIRYLVEFSIEGDDDVVDGYYEEDVDEDDVVDDEGEMSSKIDLMDVQCCQDPVSRTATGLLVANRREGVLLEEVHVRGHITDLAAKITVLQVYQSQISDSTIREARYVFPLDEKAAVCGFEAFINDKHVVGTVKTKEKAQEEYQEAVREGHGAYLMQEEASNVFSVSMGNLPPRARVVIKITYVTELAEEEGNKMAFYLLGSVAPWLQEEIRGTKLTEEKRALTGVATNVTERKESLQLTMEMASDISSVESPTHTIRVKREKTRATVTLGDGVQLGDGFQLLINVINPNTPRIWTEYDPTHNSYASMAVFYPIFLSALTANPEVVLLLDCSTSMKGEPKQDAKKICKLILQTMPKKSRFNVITFGTDFTELFPSVKPADQLQLDEALEFIENARSVGGSSEAWRPLRSLSLLPMMTSTRNVLLVSDGHLTNEKLTLEIASKYKNVNRIFTCAVSSTGNRHILRALADVSGGAFESFGPKAKSKWEGKITAHIDRYCQPSVSCVKATWQTEEKTNTSSEPSGLIQIPAQTSSVFTGSKVLLFSLGPKVKEMQLTTEIAGRSVVQSLKTPTESDGTSMTLHRLAARALVRDWEIGSFHRDLVSHETRMYDLKKYLTDLSIRLSVVTPLTSFIAVEKRDGETKPNTCSPDVAELLSMITRDDLESSSWSQVVPGQEGPAESIVTKILRQAKVAQSNFSYSSAERYYTSAYNIAKENMSSIQNLFQKCCLEMSKFTLRVKGNAEKALQWIQPALTDVAERGREEEELGALDTSALEFSQLLDGMVRESQPEIQDIPFDTTPIQRVPTRKPDMEGIRRSIMELRELAANNADALLAQDMSVDRFELASASFQPTRTRIMAKKSIFPSFSFLKPKKKKKKGKPKLLGAAPGDLHGLSAMSRGASGIPRESASDEPREQRRAELVYGDDIALSPAASTIAAKLDPSKLDIVDDLLEKSESLEASRKSIKKKVVLYQSKKRYFGWMKGRGRKEEKKAPVKTIPTIGFSLKRGLFGSGDGERPRTIESREEAGPLPHPRMLAMAMEEEEFDEEAEDVRIMRDEPKDLDEMGICEEPISKSSAESSPSPLRSMTSSDQYPGDGDEVYSAMGVSDELTSGGSTPSSSPHIGARKLPTSSPPSPVEDAGYPGTPSPPPASPPLPTFITQRNLIPTPHLPPPKPGPPQRPPPDGTAPPSLGLRPPPPPPPPPRPPAARAFPPMAIVAGGAPSPVSSQAVPPPPPPPPPAPPFPLRPPGSAPLPARHTRPALDMFVLSKDFSLGPPKAKAEKLRSPITIRGSMRNVSEVKSIISKQNKAGFWTWKDHEHMVDELFVMDFQEIFNYYCKLVPSLQGHQENLSSILLTLLLLLYLREVLSGMDRTAPPSLADEDKDCMECMTCMTRAEDWLSHQRLRVFRVKAIRDVIEANFEK